MRPPVRLAFDFSIRCRAGASREAAAKWRSAHICSRLHRAVPRPAAAFADDPVDAARLALRLAALASALEDLPGQARRFARWRARRDALRVQIRQGRHTGRAGRAWPLRPGRPPGGRQKPVHEVHEVLNVVHGLAFWVLNSPDTS